MLPQPSTSRQFGGQSARTMNPSHTIPSFITLNGPVREVRTTDLVEAIVAHASRGNLRLPASEANAVVARFRHLEKAKKEDLLTFLRSL